jgi:hypothetical protein
LPPIDLKRQGQAEKHLASFYPETIEEKEAPFQTPIKNLKMKVQHVNINDTLKKYKFDLSGEDLECILIRAKLLAAMNNHLIITKADLEETVWDFNPLSYPHEIELQNLVAMLECTSREMLPKRFQNLERTVTPYRIVRADWRKNPSGKSRDSRPIARAVLSSSGAGMLAHPASTTITAITSSSDFMNVYFLAQ